MCRPQHAQQRDRDRERARRWRRAAAAATTTATATCGPCRHAHGRDGGRGGRGGGLGSGLGGAPRRWRGFDGCCCCCVAFAMRDARRLQGLSSPFAPAPRRASGLRRAGRIRPRMQDPSGQQGSRLAGCAVRTQGLRIPAPSRALRATAHTTPSPSAEAAAAARQQQARRLCADLSPARQDPARCDNKLTRARPSSTPSAPSRDVVAHVCQWCSAQHLHACSYRTNQTRPPPSESHEQEGEKEKKPEGTAEREGREEDEKEEEKEGIKRNKKKE